MSLRHTTVAIKETSAFAIKADRIYFCSMGFSINQVIGFTKQDT
jgi:hypothetical protein